MEEEVVTVSKVEGNLWRCRSAARVPEEASDFLGTLYKVSNDHIQ